jgi:hypothetical protein
VTRKLGHQPLIGTRVSVVESSRNEAADDGDNREGPLFDAAFRHAGDVDRAETATERRKGWLRLIPSALAAVAENFLRETALFGALLACVVAVFAGIGSDSAGWQIGLVAAAVVGALLAITCALRRWSISQQWSVYLLVILVEVGLIIAMEQMTG